MTRFDPRAAVRAVIASLAAVPPLLGAAPLYGQEACDPADSFCAQVQQIADTEAFRDAVRFLDESDAAALDELIALTEIPAPPFGEGPRGEAFAQRLRDAGADSVWVDSVGNVLAIRRGTTGARTVAIVGHLDTVFPEETDVTVKVRGDTLFAPGVGDDTRGLVVVLQILRALEAGGIETAANLLFVGSVGEEGLGDLRGVKHLFREGGPTIDSFIAVDGGSDARIVNQALGSRRYRVTFAGPGGHSWGAFGMANPAHALGHALQRFDDAAGPFVADGPRTSYNVGRIGGGTSINSIPFEAWAEIDMRSESQERLLRIDSLFRAVIPGALERENEARTDGPPLTVDIALVGDRPSGEVDPATPLVQRALAASRHYGIEPTLARSSTDANVPISLGIPAITISRGGDGGNAHSPDEWWRNEDGVRAIQRALLLVIAEAAGPAAS